MRVLVLSQHYWPEVAATAQLLSDVCEDLTRAGCEVSVVCGQPSYRTLDRQPLAPTEDRNGVHIHRVWSHIPNGRDIPQRVVNYGTYFSSSLVAALRARRPDVCLVLSTPPLLLGISGAVMRVLRNVPFVYSVQDLYPDVAVHLGVLKANSPLTHVLNLLTQACYRSAAANITLSRGMAAKLVAKGVDRSRVHVISNWADTDEICPQPRTNSFAREHELHGFVVQYAGNLGMSQGLDAVLGAATMLRELPITFALIGDGNARRTLEREATSRGLRNVRFIPPQPRERLSQLLGTCEIGLITMKVGISDDLVPSKLYGIMAAGRPVLAAVEENSEVARVVRESKAGWVVRPEDPESLAAGIQQAYRACPDELRLRGENGRALCAAEYSRQVATRRYRSVLEAVVARHQNLQPKPISNDRGVRPPSPTVAGLGDESSL